MLSSRGPQKQDRRRPRLWGPCATIVASVAARALGPRREPQAGGAGWNRDADQEQWVRAWVWNGSDHAVEMGMAVRAEGHLIRVENCLVGLPGVGAHPALGLGSQLPRVVVAAPASPLDA